MTAWEIGMLVAKGRLSLATTVHDYVRALFGHSGVVVAALTPAIAAAATALPGRPPRDPADRILIATAAAYGARFVTRDDRILQYAQATRQLRCVPC